MRNLLKKRPFVTLLAAATAGLVLGAASGGSAQNLDLSLLTATADPSTFNTVTPGQFDPSHTDLVQGAWLPGIGCPTGASPTTGTFTDAACTTGDSQDQHNEGLLLVKTGPTGNNAAAVAELKPVKGIMLHELGYDIRKPGTGTSTSAIGSHCGAGAPRFNILTTTNFYFLGCSSPPRDLETDGEGWIRLRWGVGGSVVAYCTTGTPPFTLQPVAGPVQRIQIVFDEGYLTPSMPFVGSFPNTGGGPDEFGAAILDNIDVNRTLVGRGPVTAN